MTSGLLVSKSRLQGKVKISGAKNSVLKLMSASLLTKEKITLHNYPATLKDAQIHEGMLMALGKECRVDGDVLTITEVSSIASKLVWSERSIRNTLLILGALVARTGHGAVPLPGGCQLGDRKYDLHEMLLRNLGAEVWVENGQLLASAPNGLLGAEIHLPFRSTGATENAILCGTLAHGITKIWNPHVRPEVLDLVGFLRSLGVKIYVHGQESIEVVGTEELAGTKYSVIPDNMEAITWLIGAVITGGDVEIEGFPFSVLEVPLIHLRESGAKFYQGDDAIVVRGGNCYPIDISTGPYPGINSDMQPLFAVYGACARGESRIVDLRFPGRYGYAAELSKMGLHSEADGNLLKIHGGKLLRGTTVQAIDLRAGIALVLAGLVAEGETCITDSWQIERGYDQLLPKLKALGAIASYI